MSTKAEFSKLLERTGWKPIKVQSYDYEVDSMWEKQVGTAPLVLHLWSAGVAGTTWYSYDIELRDQLPSSQAMRIIAYGNSVDISDLAALEKKLDDTCNLLSNAWDVIAKLKEAKP